MAPKTERMQFLRAVRQLRRIRSFYAAGILLWAGSALWSGWLAPGSRQMWVSVLLMAVFTALLVAASLSLRRSQFRQRAGPHTTLPSTNRQAPTATPTPESRTRPPESPRTRPRQHHDRSKAVSAAFNAVFQCMVERAWPGRSLRVRRSARLAGETRGWWSGGCSGGHAGTAKCPAW